MPEPILRATLESGQSYDDPTEGLIFTLLNDIEAGKGAFLILERRADRSGQTFAQAARNGDGSYDVEHRDGSADLHYGTVAADLHAAHRLLVGWAFGIDGWQTQAQWSPVG